MTKVLKTPKLARTILADKSATAFHLIFRMRGLTERLGQLKDPQIVIVYRDSYHNEHKKSLSFSAVAPLCKAIEQGAKNGQFHYKYHIPVQIFDEFVQYIGVAADVDKRRSLINIDNILYFNILAKQLQCSILTEDCKAYVSNSQELKNLQTYVPVKRDKASMREFVLKNIRQIFCSCFFFPNEDFACGQISDLFMDVLYENTLMGKIRSEWTADVLEMMGEIGKGQGLDAGILNVASITAVDWSTMPRRFEHVYNDTVVMDLPGNPMELIQECFKIRNTLKQGEQLTQMQKKIDKLEAEKTSLEEKLHKQNEEIIHTRALINQVNHRVSSTISIFQGLIVLALIVWFIKGTWK